MTLSISAGSAAERAVSCKQGVGRGGVHDDIDVAADGGEAGQRAVTAGVGGQGEQGVGVQFEDGDAAYGLGNVQVGLDGIGVYLGDVADGLAGDNHGGAAARMHLRALFSGEGDRGQVQGDDRGPQSVPLAVKKSAGGGLGLSQARGDAAPVRTAATWRVSA